MEFISASLPPGVISKSGFQYGKFANNLFSILKQLVTVPKMGKIHQISNMTFWGNFAIFETTATAPPIRKKMKKFDLNQKLPQNREIPLFWWETRWAVEWILKWWLKSPTKITEFHDFGTKFELDRIFSFSFHIWGRCNPPTSPKPSF